ncbi:uncharacterized protein MYCFIDRAFT_211087 [Pseudocercospora fijiensis CIRAD86]|uniref:Uncharacterized protein n=1 Tax=Pseudocercospora fijiensis (strain CIRAD86) TaxID=383855 RepID=M3ADF0_PSEFD|nr:uncharacterized protein MYCFIDRAFT_211087 [Pseudocercospora fijiensis CIRAD86]EME82571.1 hypothetical protein MYCFIDRAFT_211087 [Pseudocercospora fijiensis CIRAD86]
MADQAPTANTSSQNPTSTNPDAAEFLPLQTDQQQPSGKYHHEHGDHNGDLESGPPPPEYGTINRGETTAAELWDRHQRDRSCFNADVFFALIVTFALLAVSLSWLVISPLW